ncbi:MAG: carboxypeptidase-like regulatory domain-containing protein, partial [Candidatus Acidiferrum sp.]
MARRILLLTASAFLFMLPASQAQITSTIQGAVTDKQGLAVSGAQLQLSSDVLGTSRTTVSDANGAYQFPNLPAGVYSLAVTHAGFATSSFKDLNVTLNRVLSLNVVLELGTVGEVVKVSADLP